MNSKNVLISPNTCYVSQVKMLQMLCNESFEIGRGHRLFVSQDLLTLLSQKIDQEIRKPREDPKSCLSQTNM